MPVQDIILEKLKSAFAASRMEVANDSHLHAGHASSPGSGESHFRVLIVSDRFEGKSRLERHRMVNEVLVEELSGPVHALAIRALTPQEDADQTLGRA